MIENIHMKHAIELESLEGKVEELRNKNTAKENEEADLLRNMKALKHDVNKFERKAVRAAEMAAQATAERDTDRRAARIEQEDVVEKLKTEYETQISDMEQATHARIKQLAKEFSCKMAEKEREFQLTFSEAVEKSTREEDHIVYAHRRQIDDLHKELAERDRQVDDVIEDYQVQIAAGEMSLKSLREETGKTINGLKEELLAALKEVAEAREAIEQLDSQNTELQAQVESQVGELANLRLAESDQTVGISKQTEFEYLKNLLYEYMLGRETKTLARVICTLLKFSPDQTTKIFEKNS